MRIGTVLLATTITMVGAAFAATPFDGVYRGTFTWAGNGNYRCTPSGDLTVRVVDGKFTYGASDGNPVVVEIGPDGSFSGQSGQRYLSGKIQAGQLTATMSASRCNFMWSAKK